jgi:hypothetical protein
MDADRKLGEDARSNLLAMAEGVGFRYLEKFPELRGQGWLAKGFPRRELMV